MLLTDGQNRVLFHRPVPYPGGHGFHQRIDLVGGPFQGSVVASSYESPEALRGFHRQLVALYETLQGEARLPDTYDYVALSLNGDGLGHIAVRVDVRTPHRAEARLTFSFTLDQTQLPAIITAVEHLSISVAQSE